jgi:outer membrane protein assembly factor BamB
LARPADAGPKEPPPAGRLIASPEPGWPQWRGPRRDGICDETGLLQQWPAGGPKLLWQTAGLGRGYCAPIITARRIYLTGDVGDQLHIFALDLQGQRLWQSRNGRAWSGPYPGARASCTYSEGRLYHRNAYGRVACLDAATGAELWAVDVLERFGGKTITWGLAENLLVDGPRLIVTAGGTTALMAALDKKTGATVWTTEPLRLGKSGHPAQERLTEPEGEADTASYGSPILFTLGGRRHLVSSSLRHIFGVDADTGKLLWTRPFPTRYLVIAATPVLVGDAVFVTAPDTDSGGLFRILPMNICAPESAKPKPGLNSSLSPSEGERAGVRGVPVRVEKLWAAHLDTCHGGQVYVNGALYGSYYRHDKGWACLDARTGQVLYQTKELAQGSALYADGRLYCLSQEGEMTLLKPTPHGFEFTGRFRLVPDRKDDAWTHPVILDKRLYLRYHDTLYCYDVQASQSRP